MEKDEIKYLLYSDNFWSRVIVMIISVFILAINFNLFLQKNNLVIGGTSGVATILTSIININPAFFILAFNSVLIIISFFLLGKKETLLTLIGSLLYPLFVSWTGGLCDFLATQININDLFMISFLSGIMYGIGNGFVYRTGFTTGGIDIIVKIINKYLKIPTGSCSFLVNIIIIILGAFTFGFDLAIYAVLILFINKTLVDKILIGISDSKMYYINTDKPELVEELIYNMGAGYTLLKSHGGYSNKKRDLIMCVLPTKDYYIFKIALKELDSDAFFIVSDCYDVYGGRRKSNISFLEDSI